MSTENTSKFLIPSFNLDILSEKIVALNRRAKKLGCAEIVTKVLGVITKQEREVLPDQDEQGNHKFRTVTRTYYEVEVEGIAPKFADWEFMGTLEHTEAGNILRSLPGKELPETFRTGGAKCDHCNKVRRRKDTYIVRHQTSGEMKQVGHQCVRDFLGHVDPAHLAWLASLIRDLEEAGSEEGSGRSPEVIYADHFVDYVAECVIRFGWTSMGAVRAYAAKAEGGAGITSTSSRAYRYMYPTQEMKRDGDIIEISPAATELAAKALAWGRALVNQETRNQYEHNLAMVCSKQTINTRDMGILASVVSAYQKFMGVQELRRVANEKRKSLAETSTWFGTPGKREVFTVTVVGEHSFDSSFQYGPETFTLYRMQDANGNVCIWKTGSHNLSVGKTYKLKATVKEHAVWKEIKQTVFSRCAVVEEMATA